MSIKISKQLGTLKGVSEENGSIDYDKSDNELKQDSFDLDHTNDVVVDPHLKMQVQKETSGVINDYEDNYDEALASTRRGQKSMILDGTNNPSSKNVIGVVNTHEDNNDSYPNLSIDDLIKSNSNSPRQQVYQNRKNKKKIDIQLLQPEISVKIDKKEAGNQSVFDSKDYSDNRPNELPLYGSYDNTILQSPTNQHDSKQFVSVINGSLEFGSNKFFGQSIGAKKGKAPKMAQVSTQLNSKNISAKSRNDSTQYRQEFIVGTINISEDIKKGTIHSKNSMERSKENLKHQTINREVHQKILPPGIAGNQMLLNKRTLPLTNKFRTEHNTPAPQQTTETGEGRRSTNAGIDQTRPAISDSQIFDEMAEHHEQFLGDNIIGSHTFHKISSQCPFKEKDDRNQTIDSNRDGKMLLQEDQNILIQLQNSERAQNQQKSKFAQEQEDHVTNMQKKSPRKLVNYLDKLSIYQKQLEEPDNKGRGSLFKLDELVLGVTSEKNSTLEQSTINQSPVAISTFKPSTDLGSAAKKFAQKADKRKLIESFQCDLAAIATERANSIMSGKKTTINTDREDENFENVFFNQNKQVTKKILSLEKAKIVTENNENVQRIRYFGQQILGKREKTQLTNNQRIQGEVEEMRKSIQAKESIDKELSSKEKKIRNYSPRIREIKEFIDLADQVPSPDQTILTSDILDYNQFKKNNHIKASNYTRNYVTSMLDTGNSTSRSYLKAINNLDSRRVSQESLETRQSQAFDIVKEAGNLLVNQDLPEEDRAQIAKIQKQAEFLQPIKITESSAIKMEHLGNDSKGLKKLRNLSLLDYKKNMDARKSHLTTFRAKFAHRYQSNHETKQYFDFESIKKNNDLLKQYQKEQRTKGYLPKMALVAQRLSHEIEKESNPFTLPRLATAQDMINDNDEPITIYSVAEKDEKTTSPTKDGSKTIRTEIGSIQDISSKSKIEIKDEQRDYKITKQQEKDYKDLMVIRYPEVTKKRKSRYTGLTSLSVDTNINPKYWDIFKSQGSVQRVNSPTHIPFTGNKIPEPKVLDPMSVNDMNHAVLGSNAKFFTQKTTPSRHFLIGSKHVPMQIESAHLLEEKFTRVSTMAYNLHEIKQGLRNQMLEQIDTQKSRMSHKSSTKNLDEIKIRESAKKLSVDGSIQKIDQVDIPIEPRRSSMTNENSPKLSKQQQQDKRKMLRETVGFLDKMSNWKYKMQLNEERNLKRKLREMPTVLERPSADSDDDRYL